MLNNTHGAHTAHLQDERTGEKEGDITNLNISASLYKVRKGLALSFWYQMMLSCRTLVFWACNEFEKVKRKPFILFQPNWIKCWPIWDRKLKSSNDRGWTLDGIHACICIFEIINKRFSAKLQRLALRQIVLWLFSKIYVLFHTTFSSKSLLIILCIQCTQQWDSLTLAVKKQQQTNKKLS